MWKPLSVLTFSFSGHFKWFVYTTQLYSTTSGLMVTADSGNWMRSFNKAETFVLVVFRPFFRVCSISNYVRGLNITRRYFHTMTVKFFVKEFPHVSLILYGYVVFIRGPSTKNCLGTMLELDDFFFLFYFFFSFSFFFTGIYGSPINALYAFYEIWHSDRG